ncbi:NAD(P)H-binding protein [Nocardia colli]|uniref:NAD(P)H-binding protein n=1 Tax=Nocardia colli TaxID=2545717 RepID=A0A5N0ECL6_9NOCA|nr:NAD(P)H-binding protein [Nocardia colli]KAA8886249.1 NAD(P)H-binding protein [Nocardia colli]
MRVTVFGATGGIGRLVVADLSAAGHIVRAYVRDPAKVPETWRHDVEVVVGEIIDFTAVRAAVAGADVVISTLGPDPDPRAAKGRPLTRGTEHIVEAMKHHGVRRIIGNGTPSVLDIRDRRTWQTRVPVWIARTFLRSAYNELLGMSAAIMNSGLKWTIVRFVIPTNGPARGVAYEGFYGIDKLRWRVTRADIAAFTAAQIGDEHYIEAAPAISN